MSENINKPEKITQEKVIKFFKEELKYKYLGNLSEFNNENIRKDDFISYLVHKQNYSLDISEKLFDEFVKVSRNFQQGLYFPISEI